MIDISIIAKELNLPPEQVQRTVELLDAGSSIPFICRFRRDATGSLDEQQVLAIKRRSLSLRALAERKAAICKSIESQDKLTEELKVAIDKATTSREVEDCYLPFKQRKRSRASEARQKGLAPLAEDIFKGTAPEVDLAAKATEYVRVDKGLSSVDEVIAGVNELLADQFANDVELKNQIREIVVSSGKLTSKSTEPEQGKSEPKPQAKTTKAMPAADTAAGEKEAPTTDAAAATADAAVDGGATSAQPSPNAAAESAVENKPAEAAPAENVPAENAPAEAKTETTEASSSPTETPVATEQAEGAATATEPTTPAAPQPTEKTAEAEAAAAKPKKKKKKKKKKAAESPFKAYHDFKHPLAKVAHFQTLAINRGERARKLRVGIACNEQQIKELAEKKLVPADHPFAEHLKTCVQDALNRFVLPSIEREIRREMTEAAEKHALNVVSDNLRNLLMQPPLRNRRVLAIHPGYKRGCAVAILETDGELLNSDYVFVVGNQTRRDESKKKIADLVGKYDIDVIAVGNGPASREAERMVSDSIENHLMENTSIRYLMVNEAGVNVYSTSEVARQELPDVSAAVRCAISIGRRLQEPMSEFVKVSPAGIITGTFQNDVRAKHLAESLDDALRFSVNRVGVDANTANASLLSYISGLNPLTAKRLVEHREKSGGFKNRGQLKEVNGVGDETFVQAAGFLRIAGGDHPLDSTSIHPENYSLAEKIIQKVDSSVAELFPQETRKPQNPPAAPAEKTDAEKTENETATTQQLPAAETEPSSAAAAVKEEATPAQAVAETATDSSETESPTPESPAADAQPDAEAATQQESAAPTPPEASSDAKPEAKKKPAAPEKPVPPRPDNRPSAELVAARKNRREIVDRIIALDVDKLAAEFSVTPSLVTDVVRAMKKPDWDPREKRRKPIMRRTMVAVGDLEVGQELEAQVVNVVDFGAFVDIGIGESCLVHVSQLSNRFIRDPQVVFNNGDVIRVWVTEIDSNKRRIKLTAVRPGTDRSRSRGRRPENAGRRSDSSARKTGSGSGKPSSGRKPNRQRGDKKKSFQKSWKPKRAPKPVKPITDDMLAGDAPMTSFSDLVQFVKKKPENESDK